MRSVLGKEEKKRDDKENGERGDLVLGENLLRVVFNHGAISNV